MKKKNLFTNVHTTQKRIHKMKWNENLNEQKQTFSLFIQMEWNETKNKCDIESNENVFDQLIVFLSPTLSLSSKSIRLCSFKYHFHLSYSFDNPSLLSANIFLLFY